MAKSPLNCRPVFHSKYIKKGPNDIGKWAIPKKDRCPDFDFMWAAIMQDVLKYWDYVPVEDVKEFDGYEEVKTEEDEGN